MSSFRCLQVDAFTDRPFGGNPAAICLLTRPLKGALMQAIAAEMNLSETAFVEPQESGFRLRWFTPVVEVALCGHATLAAAHVLWSERIVDEQDGIEFHSKSGVLRAQKKFSWIQLDFPRQDVQQVTAPPELVESLGAAPAFFGKSGEDAFVVVNSEATLRGLKPDFCRLAELPLRGVIVTSPSDDSRYDFASRFFAPRSGINEDPVTGSAHCSLAPYWAQKIGREDLVGYQASRRGGVVQVGVRGNRILLGGQAVTMFRGQWILHEARP